jgi:hypothetical protein
MVSYESSKKAIVSFSPGVFHRHLDFAVAVVQCFSSLAVGKIFWNPFPKQTKNKRIESFANWCHVELNNCKIAPESHE